MLNWKWGKFSFIYINKLLCDVEKNEVSSLIVLRLDRLF